MPQIWLFSSMSANYFSGNTKIEKSGCKLYLGFVKDLAYILKRLQLKSQNLFKVSALVLLKIQCVLTQ